MQISEQSINLLANQVGQSTSTSPLRTGTERHTALPSVFVVGAAKSGTTAIYHYFKQHPQVFVPRVKEPNYMSFYGGYIPAAGPGDHHMAEKCVTNFDEYCTLYAGRSIEPIAADISPTYLISPFAAEKIAELCPHAKIAIVLRNPIECAFSMYSMLRRDRRETCRTFRESFNRSAERLARGWEWAWDLARSYLFAGQVKRYFDLFPREQLFVRRYEELKSTPRQFYSELCQFLDINEIDVATSNRQVNTACTKRDLIRTRKMGRWALRAAHIVGFALPRSIKQPLRDQYLSPPAFTLSREDRQMLVNHFGPDILELEALLDCDLRNWLKV